jgi:hypothetical protein
MFENIGEVAVGVAWELAPLQKKDQERELNRMRADNPVFHALVLAHLAKLQV